MSEKKSNLVLIAAVAENGVIGLNGDIPWRKIKELSPIVASDLGRFKRVTKEHAVITGRLNYESIPERFRPLPDRLNVVVSTSSSYTGDNLVTARTIDEALQIAGDYRPGKPVFCIGGGQIYQQMIGSADVLDITEIPLNPEGNVFFPRIDENMWRETSREKQPEGHSFVTYQRR